MTLLMKKFKKFTRSNKKFYKGETSRRPYKQDRDEEEEKKKEDQALCYNCRKPGHFKANCPYPIVKKYTDEERNAWKEKKDKELRKGRKAMKASEDEAKKKQKESSSMRAAHHHHPRRKKPYYVDGSKMRRRMR
ncbi:hypothetical protein Dimus_039439 [Dionaea muscipula]